MHSTAIGASDAVVILVVASCVDPIARRLLAESPSNSALLMTPRDLSMPGWHVNTATPSRSIFVADGRRLDTHAITGVICRLPCVFPAELVHIDRDDREYVASEMTAFLVFWLSSLQCPKLNQPTAGCLSGPHWSRERWLAEAAAAGLTVRPLRRGTRTEPHREPPPEACPTVTVIGRHCHGDSDTELRRRSRALASAVGVDLLDVRFETRHGDHSFVNADPFPELRDDDAVESVWNFFRKETHP